MALLAAVRESKRLLLIQRNQRQHITDLGGSEICCVQMAGDRWLLSIACRRIHSRLDLEAVLQPGQRPGFEQADLHCDNSRYVRELGGLQGCSRTRTIGDDAPKFSTSLPDRDGRRGVTSTACRVTRMASSRSSVIPVRSYRLYLT